MTFESHKVGDVRIRHLPELLRKALMRSKKDHMLPVDFEAGSSLPYAEFRRCIQDCQSQVLATASIIPYEDVEAAISSLADHLDQHDSVALWQPDGDLTFVLYSPHSAGWRSGNHPSAPDGPRLFLQVRNGIPRLVDAKQAGEGLGKRPSLDGAELGMDAGEANEGSRRSSPLRRNDVLSDGLKADESSKRTPLLGQDRRQSTVMTANNCLGGTSLLDGQNAVHDWTFKADVHKLLRLSPSNSPKPFVYIAISDEYNAQMEAVKRWATSHTSERFVFCSTEDEWETFETQVSNSTTPSLLLFHSADPSYCTLRNLGDILGKDNVACFNISWSVPGGTVQYAIDRIFPRGTVLFISEHSLTYHGEDVMYALDWFRRQSKGKSTHWKVMVRPNIRAWLQQRAMDGAEEEAKKYIDILVLLHKISGIIDVTTGADIRKPHQLNAMTTAEDFIVPPPRLSKYDDSIEASTSEKSIRERDDILIKHFIGWSVLKASNHRRFVALDHGSGDGSKKPECSEHIVFRTPQKFRKHEEKRESKETITASSRKTTGTESAVETPS